jgi:YbbR domain-containing protein
MSVKDDSEDNYERTYTAPENVTIKGSKSMINKISSVMSKEVDVSYIYDDEEILIDYDLPEGVVIADESLGQTMKLKVKQKESEE